MNLTMKCKCGYKFRGYGDMLNHLISFQLNDISIIADIKQFFLGTEHYIVIEL